MKTAIHCANVILSIVMMILGILIVAAYAMGLPLGPGGTELHSTVGIGGAGVTLAAIIRLYARECLA